MATILFLLALGVEGGCSDGGGGAARIVPTGGTTATPTDTNSEETTDTTTETTTSPEPVVETLPAIEETEVTVIKRTVGPTVKRLSFEAGDGIDEGRYTSEFLLVLTATKPSCVRVKVHPSGNVTAGASSVDADEDADDLGCANLLSTEVQEEVTTNAAGETVPAADAAADAAVADAATALALATPPGPFALATTTADLCSQRLFRVDADLTDELGASQGLGKVHTKTGYLMAQDSNVRVWLDHEVGNPCISGSPADLSEISLLLSRFNPRSYPDGYKSTKDRLRTDFFDNLAEDGQAIYDLLTATYGAVSDVDGNGAIDIFISPEVNRTYFENASTSRHDQFAAKMIHKPADLAAYNSTKNPSSNEGEIVYLWAPDPGGLYTYSQFPTANSLASNYAKGYIGAQLMTLIVLNHTQIQRAQPEERWLIEALAYLASAYVAGNDYSVMALADYLTYRHHYIPLVDPIDTKSVAEPFRYNLGHAQQGMRAMFGWYLHARLCGQSGAMCAKIKDLIDSDNVGIANVEAVLADSFPDILDNFGTSVGVAVADDPTAAIALLTTANEADSTVDIPVTMPPLQEVNVDDPRQTVEQDPNAENLTTGDDRAIAGPFPSLGNMVYQPVLPDNDLTLKLAENSVTYILLTGLITPTTEMSLYLGEAVSTYVTPLGDRDPDSRQLHVEKVSELAHLDQRPINLTAATDANLTTFGASAHAGDFRLTQDRELWVVGSIDNFKVALAEGGSQEIGDTDAYNISVDVCLGADDVTECRAGVARRVIFQLIPRDFEKELAGSMLVMPTSLMRYRGRAFMPTLQDMGLAGDDRFSVDSSETVVLCESAAIHQTTADYTKFKNCANGGLLAAEFDAEVCESDGNLYAPGNCSTGEPSQSVSYDGFSYAHRGMAGPTYDNFFYSGALGFPHLSSKTLAYRDIEAKGGRRTFQKEEIFRQFFHFDYREETKAETFRFLPMWSGHTPGSGSGYARIDSDLATIDEERLQNLISLHEALTATAAVSTEVVAKCIALNLNEELCQDAKNRYALLEADIQKMLVADRILCVLEDGVFTSASDIELLCPGLSLTKTNTVGTVATAMEAWISPEQLLLAVDSPSSAQRYTTFYKPTFVDAPVDGYCGGGAAASGGGTEEGEDYGPCYVKSGRYTEGDLRHQLNIPAALFTHNCDSLTHGSAFLACADYYSFSSATSKALFAPTFAQTSFTVERERLFAMPIARRAGEIVGKQHQLLYTSFLVPADKAYTIQIMVGGLKKSQGKYLLRGRVTDFVPAPLE